jgi:hypothetical protein
VPTSIARPAPASSAPSNRLDDELAAQAHELVSRWDRAYLAWGASRDPEGADAAQEAMWEVEDEADALCRSLHLGQGAGIEQLQALASQHRPEQ